jgi:TonB-dependent receptor
VQHAFADTGFGVIANLTLVDGDVKFNNGSLGDQFAVFGMSDSANLIGFYDKHGLQARIAYNWRDKHLVADVHGTGHSNPIYTEAYGQWDISVSYDVNDNLTVFAEGINVTDEYTRQSSRRSEQVLNVVELGPRYNIGLRYTF